MNFHFYAIYYLVCNMLWVLVLFHAWCRSCPNTCADSTSVHTKRRSSSQLWFTGYHLKRTNQSLSTSPRCWRSLFLRIWSGTCRPMTGNGWVREWHGPHRLYDFMIYEISTLLLELLQLHFILTGHCDGLQSACWEKSGRSQAHVPENHLQVAYFWISLFWNQGNYIISA